MRYAIYTRLSKSDDDRAVSLEQQSDACQRYVEGQGGTVALEAQDVRSGLDVQRPGYQGILQAARDKRIGAVVVWRWDRFGRDTAEALRALKELADLGVDVRSVTENSGDAFLRDLMLLLANRESRVISARVKPVMTMQAKAGRWQGRPPAGYDLTDGRLAPNAQAPLIRELFQMAATGDHSIAALRRWAHGKGLVSGTGKPPSRSLLHKWLANPAYMGAVVYNRRANGRFEPKRNRPESDWVVVTDAHPSIVDRATFDAVQGVLATHKQFQAGVKGSKWLLTGIAYCGHCGSRMYGRTAGRGNYTYACYRGITYDSCTLRGTGGKALDAWVKERVSGIQISPDLRQRAAEIVKAEVEQEIGERSRHRQSLEAAYERHQETRQKLAHRVMADTIPPDVYRRLEEEEATAIRAIEQEMGKLEAPPPVPDLSPVMDVLEAVTWDALDDEAWREVVALLVERVDVFALGDYRLTWSAAGESLARIVERRTRSPQLQRRV